MGERMDNTGNREWSVEYRDFLLAKARRKLATWLELPGPERPFRLFSTCNDAISTHIRAGGVYEAHVLGVIRSVALRFALGRGIALDVGANIGNHSIWMSQYFSQVIAFEPDPAMSTVLRANALFNRRTNIRIVAAALSNFCGIARMKRRRADNIGTMELVAETSADLDENTDTVEVTIGDQALSDLEVALPVSFIKIDVEGAEVAALEGLSMTLRRDHPVVCFEARNRSEGEAIRSILTASGYTHYYEIEASRLNLRNLLRIVRSRRWVKHYWLAPVGTFDNRYYAAVFAWTRELT